MFQKQKFNAIFIFQVGSFNYDNTKMRYNTYFLPSLPNSTDPILDYDVSIKKEYPYCMRKCVIHKYIS